MGHTCVLTRCRGAPWRTIPLNLNQFSDYKWGKNSNTFFSFYQMEAMNIYVAIAPRLKFVGEFKWDHNLIAIWTNSKRCVDSKEVIFRSLRAKFIDDPAHEIKVNVVVLIIQMNLNLLRTKITSYLNLEYKRIIKGNWSITLLNIDPLQSSEAWCNTDCHKSPIVSL
jgi:hypothetical protein